MGVLASREHTCIHPEVSRSSNKNEGCKTLNDPRLARLNQAKVNMSKTVFFFYFKWIKTKRKPWLG